MPDMAHLTLSVIANWLIPLVREKSAPTAAFTSQTGARLHSKGCKFCTGQKGAIYDRKGANHERKGAIAIAPAYNHQEPSEALKLHLHLSPSLNRHCGT